MRWVPRVWWDGHSASRIKDQRAWPDWPNPYTISAREALARNTPGRASPARRARQYAQCTRVLHRWLNHPGHIALPLDITFTLSDHDLEHFQAIVDKTKAKLEDTTPDKQIEDAARALIDNARSVDLPDFISTRLAKLQVVIDMINDAEWQLGDDERKRVIGALAYFCSPDDIISDSVPGLGFLDDAIYVELILRELKAEVGSYEEFCNYRIAEEDRRREEGIDTRVDREQWLADKRASLKKGLRMPRRNTSGSGWRLRW